MIRAEFGDIVMSGEFDNLNTFKQDISYWRTLKIATHNKHVNVYLDDVQIYTIKYNDPLDQVKGISFSFNGSGAVDYVKLTNSSNEIVYSDSFD
jgi:hypothetical protein